MATRKVYGACPHDCPDTCGIITEVQDGRAVDFYADPDNRVTDGWLCAKVRPYLNHVYHPERLQYPLRRISRKDEAPEFVRITWEAALAEICATWQMIIGKYGGEGILPYSYSGTLGLLQLGVANGRFWNRLGASQLERSICGAAAEEAVNVTLGTRRGVPYPHVRHSRLVIIWGHNPVSTAPHFMPHLKAAQKAGARVIVIDPRRTRTAKGADWHLQPKPATDGALALGLMHAIVNANLHDEAWLAQHALGWERFLPLLAQYPPEKVADITGIPSEQILELAYAYATTKPSLIKFADGLQRHPNGGQTSRALCLLPAITGQYGTLGGGLAYSTSGTLSWNTEALNKWSESPPPGRVVNMNRLGAALLGEVSDPPIQSLFIFAANPLAASPNTSQIARGMQREDLFTVVHELFMTDTAALADIVLPATSQLEQWDVHKAYGHTQLTLNEPAIPPLEESKSNWEVMRLLARGMEFEEAWLHQPPEEVLDEILAATAADNPALAGLTVERLRAAQGAVELTFEPEIPFADGHFPTPSGKVEIYSEQLAAQKLPPLPDYTSVPPPETHAPPADFDPHLALNLISGAAHHFVTTTFANQAGLLAREGDPFIEIHPEDAAQREIVDGDLVLVENGRGAITLRARVTSAVRPGVVVSPKGRWAKHSGGQHVNYLTSDELGDFAGQSTFHTNWVWLEPLSEGEG